MASFWLTDQAAELLSKLCWFLLCPANPCKEVLRLVPDSMAFERWRKWKSTNPRWLRTFHPSANDLAFEAGEKNRVHTNNGPVEVPGR
jgi:hypothetical protein